MAVTAVDHWIRQHVLESLRHDRRIDASRVGVDVRYGVVHLSGVVPTYAERAIAGDLVRRIHSVVDVQNDLIVAATAHGGTSPRQR